MPAKYPTALSPDAVRDGPTADSASGAPSDPTANDRDAQSLQHLNHSVLYFADIDDSDYYDLGTTATQTTSAADNRIVRAAFEGDAATDLVALTLSELVPRRIIFGATNANSSGWLHVWHS